MTQPTRRSFIAKTSLLALGATTTLAAEPSKPMLTHHVFFWLKNPTSKEDLAKLIEGVKTLEKIENDQAIAYWCSCVYREERCSRQPATPCLN